MQGFLQAKSLRKRQRVQYWKKYEINTAFMLRDTFIYREKVKITAMINGACTIRQLPVGSSLIVQV